MMHDEEAVSSSSRHVEKAHQTHAHAQYNRAKLGSGRIILPHARINAKKTTTHKTITQVEILNPRKLQYLIA